MIDDRDLDGIEDKFDSTFNTPEELLEKKGIKRIVTIEADEDMLKRLAQTDIPFFAQKNADGYKVLCDERDEERVINAMKPPPNRKVGRGFWQKTEINCVAQKAKLLLSILRLSVVCSDLLLFFTQPTLILVT